MPTKAPSRSRITQGGEALTPAFSMAEEATTTKTNAFFFCAGVAAHKEALAGGKNFLSAHGVEAIGVAI